MPIDHDQRYLDLIVNPIRVCANYKPKFGQGGIAGFTLEQFRTLYQADPFYNWFGLDNPLMYAAHKAAGGMTSVYRQIGIGCEAVFRATLMDALGLSHDHSHWSYEITGANDKKRKLHLDGRIPISEISSDQARTRFREWINVSAADVGVAESIYNSLTGAIFEVRQGYKSKDSKRQNADIANAATAYINTYLPCAVILSGQIDGDIIRRYKSERWVCLVGVLGLNNPTISTYDFMRDIIGYDLAAFFERNSARLKNEIDIVLRHLLAPDQ